MGRRQFALLFAVPLVAACTLSPTPSSITGVSGLDRSIQRYYAARAQERNASCNRPLMTIRSAQVVARDGDQWTLDVRYFFGQRSTSATGNSCTGSSQRRFVVDTSGGQAQVISMSGGQRT